MSDDPTPTEAGPDDADMAEDAAFDAFDALSAENAALKEQILRYAADAENTRRRAEREANDARAYAIQKFARDLLAVADTLGRALATPPTSEDTGIRNFVVGVEMTQKALLSAFESNGLKTVTPAAGDRFDPHHHQAMTAIESDAPAHSVVQVFQKGFKLHDRVIRPAMVAVAKPRPAADEAGTAPA